MTNNILINIANDFTVYPGARYKSDGDFSGEEFYELHLKPNLLKIWDESTKNLTINFDGTFGYASSFISEVFLRTVKDFKDKNKILKKIQFKSEDDPTLVHSIKQIVKEA